MYSYNFMQWLILFVQFYWLGLGVLLCIIKKRKMGKPWILTWTAPADLWSRRRHHPVQHNGSQEKYSADLPAGDGGSDDPGIYNRCLYGEDVPCALLGL